MPNSHKKEMNKKYVRVVAVFSCELVWVRENKYFLLKFDKPQDYWERQYTHRHL